VLAHPAVDVLDEVVPPFDQAVSARESAARTKLIATLAERACGGEDRQALFDELHTVLLDPDIADERVGTLFDAVAVLAQLYATGGRRVPADAPTRFVPTRWTGYVDTAAGAAGPRQPGWRVRSRARQQHASKVRVNEVLDRCPRKARLVDAQRHQTM
jgi:hypothetical protein